MHEDVKRFYLEGEVAYEYLAQTKETLQKSIEDNMRFVGYTPVLDIDPELSQDYDAEEEKFRIKLSLVGAYVGDKSWDIAGMMFGKPVMKSITTPKSNQSSTSAE